MRDGRVPVVLCVDCEPDLAVWERDRPSAWEGFERLAAGLTRLRDALEDATGRPARFSWALRMDPQIAATYGSAAFLVERYAQFFDEVARAGDALGIHPHAWQWDAQTDEWIAAYGDDAWLFTCIATAFESFRDGFGTTPSFHRCGNGFMSTAVMNQVRDEGTPVDLTLEPGEPLLPGGRRWGVRWVGDIPGFEGPRRPYTPDPDDFRSEAAGGGLLAVPLSSGPYVAPPRPRPSGRHRAARRLAHPVRTGRKVVQRVGGGSGPASPPPERLLAMWREWRSPDDFWQSAFTSAGRLERPYLAFAVRSDVGLPGGTGDSFRAIVDALLRHPRAHELEFTTLDAVR